MPVLDLLTEPHDAQLADLQTSEAVDLMTFCRSVLRGEFGSAISLTPRGIVDFASRPVLAHLGRDASQVAGVSWLSLWPQGERQKVQEALDIARLGKVARFQAASPTPEGAPRWWDVVVYPLSTDGCQNPEGRRMLAMFRNITALREGQEKLAQSLRMEALGQLTGGVAHDFNNLLTVILGATETLATELSAGSEHRNLAQVSLQAAERGAGLVRRLLAFSRHQSLEPQGIDCSGMIGSVQTLAERLIREDVELTVRASGVPLYCKADRAELESALLNLCINARDAMPAGGALRLEVSGMTLVGEHAHELGLIPGEFVVFTVSDTGVGMSAEVTRRAIEPFFTTKGLAGGNGLGLSTVYGFARQSGGGLTIDSRPKLGTTVRLYLPRTAGATQGQLELPMTPVEPAKSHVLLVEDDILVRAQVARALKGLGYRVTVAGDGPSALIALDASDDISLLMSDVVMPGGMNGRELADRARRHRPSLSVLLTSGYTEDASPLGSGAEAGTAFLPKPYRRAQLAAAVSAALTRPHPSIASRPGARQFLRVRQAL